MGTEQKHGKGVLDEDGGQCKEWKAKTGGNPAQLIPVAESRGRMVWQTEQSMNTTDIHIWDQWTTVQRIKLFQIHIRTLWQKLAQVRNEFSPMSDLYHELMSHLFNSPSNIPKLSYQPTGIRHCRVARHTPSLDPQVYRHMQLKIDQKEGKPLDPETRRHMQDNTGGV